MAGTLFAEPDPTTPEGAEDAEPVERLRVLGQPLRIRLIDRLDRRGEVTVSALAEELGVTALT